MNISNSLKSIESIKFIEFLRRKINPKANSIANFEIFISPSDPLHTLMSNSPLQQVVLQKQALIQLSLLQSEGSVGVDGLPWSQKRLV